MIVNLNKKCNYLISNEIFCKVLYKFLLKDSSVVLSTLVIWYTIGDMLRSDRMGLATLAYLKDGDSYLMLHRTKKKHDVNHNKWIGVGGKLEYGESPAECLKREVLEETGQHLSSYQYRGIITFIFADHDPDYLFLYTGTLEETDLRDCNEGVLKWVTQDELFDLELWDGDRLFLDPLIHTEKMIDLKLVYDENSHLVAKESY